MRTYEEISARIMQKGNKIIENRRIRNTKIRQTSFAVSGMCAAVITGVGIWRLNVKDNIPHPDSSSYVIEEKDVATDKNTTLSSNESTASAVKTSKTTAIISTSQPNSTPSDNVVTTEKQTSSSKTSEHPEYNAASSVRSTATTTDLSGTVLQNNDQTVPVTQTTTHADSQNQSGSEVITSTLSNQTTTIPTKPISPDTEHTTVPTLATSITCCVQEIVTGTTTEEAIAETATISVVPNYPEQEKRIIGPLAVERSHKSIDFNGSRYSLADKYCDISELPDGSSVIGNGIAHGNNQFNNSPYFIEYTIYDMDDEKILVRFGIDNTLYLYTKS